MKQAILISLICTALYLTAQAQTTAITVKGGYHGTWLLNKNSSDDMKMSFGHTEGVGFAWYKLPYNYYTDRMYGIALDVMYATHRQDYAGQITLPDTNGSKLINYNRSIHLTYVDIPLYFRLAHDQGASYLEIGPQYSILLSATQSFSTEGEVLPGYSDEDIKDQISPHALALMLGFGFDFPLSPGLFLSVGARATYGLTDLTQEAQNGVIEYKPTKRATGGMLVSLMYRFNSYHSSKANVKRR